MNGQATADALPDDVKAFVERATNHVHNGAQVSVDTGKPIVAFLRDDVTILCAIVREQGAENASLCERLAKLESENATLRDTAKVVVDAAQAMPQLFIHPCCSYIAGPIEALDTAMKRIRSA